MSGEAQHIDVHFLHIDRDRARRLRSIDHQQSAVRVRHFTDAGNIEHVSDQIRGVRADHGLGVRPEQFLHILVPDIALFVRRNEIHRRAARLQVVQRPQHGIVLEIGRNDMVARRNQPVECDIERLGRVRGEHDMVRPRTAEQLRQPCAGVEHHARGRQRHAMRAARGISGGEYRVFDRLGHFGRLVQRGRCVIQIDHGVPPSAVQLDHGVFLKAHAGLRERLQQRGLLLRLDLPRQPAARRELCRDGDEPSRQTALMQQRLRRECLLGRGERDDREWPPAPHHGRRMRSACICFSVMTYIFVTSPTASLSVRP